MSSFLKKPILYILPALLHLTKNLKKKEELLEKYNFSKVNNFFLKRLVQEEQLQESREDLKHNQEEGKSYEEKLKELKDISIGGAFLDGNNKIQKNDLILSNKEARH